MISISTLLFVIALFANLILILIFLYRKKEDYILIKKIGYGLYVVGLLDIFAIIMVVIQGEDTRLIWFLGFYLAFLVIELLFDYILKIDFRTNWKLLTLYLIFYYMANYSLIMMNWLFSSTLGLIILILFIIQLLANILTHQTAKKKNNKE
jgi:hypothetical protein